MALEDILRRARLRAKELQREARYRIALEDGIITEQELAYLAILEAVRETVYRPDTENIVKRIWTEFAAVVEATPEEAEQRWLAIEDRAITHYHRNLNAFGQYTERFPKPKQ